MTLNHPQSSFALITLMLPGPDRKRTPVPYCFRVTYRNPDPAEAGCVMTWETFGGRETYQIAVERTPGGEHAWHCSCPDAVYRGEDHPDHRCKHVQGRTELFETLGTAVRLVPAA